MSDGKFFVVSGLNDEVFQELSRKISQFASSREVEVALIRGTSLSGNGAKIAVFPTGVLYEGLEAGKVEEIIKGHIEDDTYLDTEMKYETLPVKILPHMQDRVVLRNVGVIDPGDINEYIEAGGYSALRKALTEMEPQDVIEEVKASGLRGRGGAGFPTGLKWEFTAKAAGDTRYVIANADESEPGTFKDRVIEEGDPHRLIEGIVIAAYAIGSNAGYIFVRGEHELAIKRLSKAIADAKQHGFLGRNILDSGFSFELKLVYSAGGYICGEETALIEAIEGKRGQPRPKPPYPPQAGLWGKPTLVNNVETFANVPEIILRGAQWYRSYGTESSPGTKIYSIIGNTRYRGIVEAPMGITLKELIFDYGGGIADGGQFKSALVGGAAGGFISDLDARLDFDGMKEKGGMLGSGAVLVLSDRADILGVLISIAQFFRTESCGKCVPCRVGTQLIYDTLIKIQKGECIRDDIEKMIEIAHNMRLASFCPLGQSVYLPLKSAIDIYKDELYSRCRG